MPVQESRSRVVRTSRPVPLGAVVSGFRRGGGDPTSRRDHDAWWFGWLTPDGAVTLRLSVSAAAGEVAAQAWGAGSGWALEKVPDLVGERDDPTGFEPLHAPVGEAWRVFPGWRVPRSGLVLQALVPSVIEQKVTGQEAFSGYRRLVTRFGEPAPGPGSDLGLRVPPTAAGWAGIPSWEWLAAGVDPARSRTVVRLVRHAGRIEEGADLPVEAARARLQALPGFGEAKSKIFLALLGKQCGVRPRGWREGSAPYGRKGTTLSAADVVDEASLLAVRSTKREMKARR